LVTVSLCLFLCLSLVVPGKKSWLFAKIWKKKLC